MRQQDIVVIGGKIDLRLGIPVYAEVFNISDHAHDRPACELWRGVSHQDFLPDRGFITKVGSRQYFIDDDGVRRILRRVGILKLPPLSDRNIHQIEIVGTDAAGLRKRVLRAPSWRHSFNAKIEKAAGWDDMQNADGGCVFYAG